MFFSRHRTELLDPADTLVGHDTPIDVATAHLVLGTPMTPPFPEGTSVLQLGMGCFWGAERMMWQLPGVYTTAVGYSGGVTPNPTYAEVCSGRTNHAETVLVVYDPAVVSTESVLKAFWEGHDPTQGMQQGNDVGTQYRSAIYWSTPEQQAAAIETRDRFAGVLEAAGRRAITTEIAAAGPFFYAEDDHQQYLAKNPNGYCGLGGTGLSCPIGIAPLD